MKRRDFYLSLCVLALFVQLVSHPHGNLQLAYIGPGAGFAFLGSFLTLLTSLVLSVVSLLAWPFRMLWLLVRRTQGYRKARVKKVIFLGLDGFDPGLAERFMAEGKLPESEPPQRAGLVYETPHNIPCALAGGMVHVCHGRESCQAQYFRFSES